MWLRPWLLLTSALVVGFGVGCESSPQHTAPLATIDVLAEGACAVDRPMGGKWVSEEVSCVLTVPRLGAVAIRSDPMVAEATMLLAVHDRLGAHRLRRDVRTAEWQMPDGEWIGERITLRVSSGGGPVEWRAIEVEGAIVPDEG